MKQVSHIRYIQMETVLAKTLGGYGERVEDPQEIVPAIGRAREAMSSGGPALLEFLTKEENALSRYPARAPRALP